MRPIRGLILVILCAACGSKGKPDDNVASNSVDIAPGSFREILPTVGVQAVTVRAPAQVFAIQNYRELFKIDVRPGDDFPRKVLIPVSTLASGSRQPVYVVVLPPAVERNPQELSGLRRPGESPSDAPPIDGGAIVVPRHPVADICPACEPCCPPPKLCDGSYRCDGTQWILETREIQPGTVESCRSCDVMPAVHGACTKLDDTMTVEAHCF
jgi:hypothetical protein